MAADTIAGGGRGAGRSTAQPAASIQHKPATSEMVTSSAPVPRGIGSLGLPRTPTVANPSASRSAAQPAATTEPQIESIQPLPSSKPPDPSPLELWEGSILRAE